MKNILKNDFGVLCLRILVAFASVLLFRVLFYVANYGAFGALTLAELPQIIHGSLIFDACNIAYVFGIFVIISLLPLRSRSSKTYEKIKFWCFTVGVTIISLLAISDTIYYRYVGRRGVADDLAYSKTENTLAVMLKAASEHWWVLLCAAIIAGAAIFLYRKIKYHPTNIKSVTKYYIANTGLFVLGGFLVFVAIRGSTLGGHPIMMSQATRYVNQPVKASIVLSNPLCIILTAVRPSSEYTKYYDEQELESLYTPVHRPSPDSVFTPKNVVVFIMEGFGYEISGYLNPDLYKPGDGNTPFLDSLMQKGYLFRKAYASGGGSRDAMGSVYNSIPTMKDIFMQMPQSFQATSSIASILNDEGYSTAYFNGSVRNLMGFYDYARMIGFQRAIAQEDYDAAYPGNKEFDEMWGIWDEPFLQYMGNQISLMKEPFMASVFTISSHHPYNVPEKYKNTIPKGYTASHQAIAYTDHSIRQFFEANKDKEWFKNTIFVFTADHVSPEIYAQKTKSMIGRKHILYFIYTPDGSLHGQSNTVTQQIDILPTVLGMMNYNKPYFAFGRDFFNETKMDPYVVNYADGVYQYIDKEGSCYFDETQITKAFAASDSLQQNNILGENPAHEKLMERNLKAFIQSYFQHIEKSEFTVK